MDTWFLAWVVASLWIAQRSALLSFGPYIALVTVCYVSEWIFSFIKFGRLTSYHTYSAKAFAIVIFFAIVVMMEFNYAGSVLTAALIVAGINSIENWLITLTLPAWATDVPTIFDARRRRQDVRPEAKTA